MRKLEIEIPNNKEIDWVESAKQEKIVLKDKQFTYEDMCIELFDKGHYYTDANGTIRFAKWTNECPNNASTKHQLECILAKNKLANVARYLNGEWDYYKSSDRFIIWINDNELYISASDYLTERATVIFKSVEAAHQAIEILGEDVVRLALEPLY